MVVVVVVVVVVVEMGSGAGAPVPPQEEVLAAENGVIWVTVADEEDVMEDRVVVLDTPMVGGRAQRLSRM